MTANTQCGWTSGDDGECGVEADQWAFTDEFRQYSTSSCDDVEICKQICTSNIHCAGFAYNAEISKCSFRTNVTCGVVSHPLRDCYAKFLRPPPPNIFTPGGGVATEEGPDAGTMSGVASAEGPDAGTMSAGGDPADWVMGVDDTDIYKCAKGTDTCLVNSAGSRHTFTKAARPSISMVDAEGFSHSGGDGTWSFADNKAVFSSANTDHSFSFAAGAVNM